MNISTLVLEDGKWKIKYDSKVIVASENKKYVIASILDGRSKKAKELQITRIVDEEGNEINYTSLINEGVKFKNQDFYKASVSSAVEIRHEINSVHQKRLCDLRSLFVHMFNMDARVYTYIKDMIYYQGGWPSENTPARLDTIFRHLREIIRFFKLLGKEEMFQSFASNYGLTITIKQEMCDELDNVVIKDPKTFNLEWRNLYGENPPEDISDKIKKIIQDGLDTQHIICEKADSIKITLATTVETTCDITQRNFMNAYSYAYRVKYKNMEKTTAIQHVKFDHVVLEAAVEGAVL